MTNGGFGFRVWAGSLLAVVMLAGAGVPAGAAQLGAREDPEATGPLARVSKDCSSKAERHNGKVVANTTSCTYFYAFNPARESDSGRNFGVMWLQTSVNARNGWCTRKVNSDIRIPDVARAHARGPGRVQTDHKRRVRARVTADAQGATSRPGAVEQGFTLRPRLIEPVTLKGPKRFRLKWRGKSARRLAFALGAELSWPRRTPPGSLVTAVGYEFEKRPDC